MTSAISQSIPAQTRRLDRATLGQVVVYFAASLLGLAGVLKIVEAVLRSPGVQEQTIGIFGRFALVIGLLECFLAVWIVLLRRERWILPAVAGLFSVFLGFAAYRWWVGYADCGCFGVVRVPPALTMALDALIVTAAIVLGAPIRSLGRVAMLLPVPLLGIGAGLADVETLTSPRCHVAVEKIERIELPASANVTKLLVYNSACPKCKFIAEMELPPDVARADVSVWGITRRGQLVRLEQVLTGCVINVPSPLLITVDDQGTVVASRLVRIGDSL